MGFDIELFESYFRDHTLDETRKRLIKRIGRDLSNLFNGSSSNRFRKLVLGSETALLLREIQIAASIQNVIPCFIDCRFDKRNPSSCIWDALPLKIRCRVLYAMISDRYCVLTIDRVLKSAGLVMLVVVDHLEEIYKLEKGECILGELRVIGGIDKGAIHCIITGDRILSQLMFNQISVPGYYSFNDMNHTKYELIQLS